MLNPTIVFVSAGMNRPKKKDHPFARLNLYLNYGLLGLASMLKRLGYSTQMFHGTFQPASHLIEKLKAKYLIETQYPLFLSIPSCFALQWAQEFCKCLKAINPRIKIIVGGRWVVGTDGAWIKRIIPEIDLVVYGTAEGRIEEFLNPKLWYKIPFTDLSNQLIPDSQLRNLPDLDYTILENFRDYQPSIECARGCGMGCSFCVEKDSPLTQMKSPRHIIESIGQYIDLYKSTEFHPYFEASYFRPTLQWATEFELLYKNNRLSQKWRCETRVDGLSIDVLYKLASAGLRVIDLGLESASHRQLIAMNKTSKPDTYLDKASKFLKRCNEYGVMVKVNILLYAGETFQSINETIDWLDKHKHCIKGVSVGSLIVYRFNSHTKTLLDQFRRYGAYPVDEYSIETQGYTQMNLSTSIDVNAAQELSTQISQHFMTDKEYYDLKSFSYFARGFTYDDFLKILDTIHDPCGLPFYVNRRKPVLNIPSKIISTIYSNSQGNIVHI